jgi:hypothetical protein
MSITPANLGRGFTIGDFVAGFPNGGGPSGIGPIGIAFTPGGSVLLGDYYNSTLYSVPSHTDGQFVSTIVQSYPGGRQPFALAQIQISSTWHYYTATIPNFYELDPTTGAYTDSIVGIGGLGLVPYPPSVPGVHAGHLFLSGGGPRVGGGGIVEIDPVSKAVSLFYSGTQGDGICFSADGAYLYMAIGDQVSALDMSTASIVWSSSLHTSEGFDGIAAGLGTLDGYVYSNANSGNLWEFGVPWGAHPGVEQILATGGTRGDFIAIDATVTSGGFPSLLLTQTDRIVRIDPPGGGWVGPPTSSTIAVGGSTSVPPGTVEGGLRLIVCPNPSRGLVQASFALARESWVRASVLDLQGRELTVIANEARSAGVQNVRWNPGSQAAPGLYFMRIETEGRVTKGRFVLDR